LRLFQAGRADVECFARDLEARGRAWATISRGLCSVAGFSRNAELRHEAPCYRAEVRPAPSGRRSGESCAHGTHITASCCSRVACRAAVTGLRRADVCW